jgi:hypothetical protein
MGESLHGRRGLLYVSRDLVRSYAAFDLILSESKGSRIGFPQSPGPSRMKHNSRPRLPRFEIA